MAQEIVNELTILLDPHGVAVYLEAHHSCTQARGVKEANAFSSLPRYLTSFFGFVVFLGLQGSWITFFPSLKPNKT